MTMIRDYNALADGLNKIQQRIVECEHQIKAAKTPEDVVYLIRRKKMLKHMQNLMFCPDRAQAFIEKHQEVDANQPVALSGVTNDAFKYFLAASNFSGKAF